MADQTEGNETPEFDTEDTISFEQAMKALDEKMAERANDEPEQDEIILWATVTYEEGTSGPILKAEGVLVDDEYGVSILDPETNEVTSVGDRFVISVVVRQVFIEDDEDDEDEAEIRMGGSEGPVISKGQA